MNGVIARGRRMGIGWTAEEQYNIAQSTNPLSSNRIAGTLGTAFVFGSGLLVLFGSGSARTLGLVGLVGSGVVMAMALRGIT